MVRPSLDSIYIDISKLMSKRSTCSRKQVGGILVKDGKIISCGYNGTPSGMQHCTDYWEQYCKDNNLDHESFLKSKEFYDLHGDYSRKYETHAEQSLISYVSRDQSVGSTMYLTLSPCSDCAKLILHSGIKRVVFVERYDRDTSGIDLLKSMGVECEQYK